MSASDLATDRSIGGPRPMDPAAPLPWWNFKIVWLVWGLPAAVVVASLVTASIAWRHVDPVITDTPSGGSVSAGQGDARSNALEPAQRARNHAATPLR